jgi:predicted nucleotidyltransferase component of viral defense system
MEKTYKDQVQLLVNVIPYIAKEECFALKGGTAINLFYNNLPRLSVDIDLSYIEFDDRVTAYQNINAALMRISNNLLAVGFSARLSGDKEKKLICSNQYASIKIEPNYVIRGYAYAPEVRNICAAAEDLFGFAEILTVSKEELYGGKICAALDRQHPRDLFDIKELLDNSSIDDELFKGFLVMLLGHDRPLHEVLNPRIQEHHKTWQTEFIGMTDKEFSYEEHEKTLQSLIEKVQILARKYHKDFLLDFVRLQHNWKDLEVPNIDKMPAILWKLQNLEKLRSLNPVKFEEQYILLRQVLK